MKKILLFLTLFVFKTSIGQKIFTLDPASPGVSLNNANGSCTTPGTLQPNVFDVTVSGVGVMNSTNQLTLASIGLSDCGSGSKNLNEVQIRLISPSGVCVGIYSGGLSTIATGVHFINLVSNAPCVNNPNTSNEPNSGSSLTASGNNGYYNAQFNGVNANYSLFTGNADGVWKVVFSESTVSPPCVEVIRLFFGDPTVKDLSTQGDNCSNPIVWDGKYQICGNTSGKMGSVQMPGSINGPNTNTFGTINGQVCGWNFANNNDVWIKYTATKSNTCLAISGISGTNIALQSVVVTDVNTNDTDPCTQLARTATNDPNWQVVSCPRPSIYGTTAGTQYNQQHCFTSEIGKTYYLVIDGDGGANSKFHVWGFDFNGVLNIQESPYYIFTPDRRTSVSYVNGVIISKNITSYKQSITIYNYAGAVLYNTERMVRNNDIYDVSQYLCNGFNLIKLVIDDHNVYLFKYIKK